MARALFKVMPVLRPARTDGDRTIPTFTRKIFPNAIQIRADHTTVRGLTVQNFGYGDNYNGGAGGVSIGCYSADGRIEYSASDIEISGNVFRHSDSAVVITGFAGSNPVYAPCGVFLAGYRILANLVTGNAGDGVYFYQYAGGLISYNTITGNQGIGIHLSDYTSLYSF